MVSRFILSFSLLPSVLTIDKEEGYVKSDLFLALPCHFLVAKLKLQAEWKWSRNNDKIDQEGSMSRQRDVSISYRVCIVPAVPMKETTWPFIMDTYFTLQEISMLT